MSIDIDDVGDGFLYGGVVIGLIVLACYLIFSKPEIDDCKERGGVPVKSNGELVCVDEKLLIKAKK
jgi:hypothetical protein